MNENNIQLAYKRNWKNVFVCIQQILQCVSTFDMLNPNVMGKHVYTFAFEFSITNLHAHLFWNLHSLICCYHTLYFKVWMFKYLGWKTKQQSSYKRFCIDEQKTIISVVRANMYVCDNFIASLQLMPSCDQFPTCLSLGFIHDSVARWIKTSCWASFVQCMNFTIKCCECVFRFDEWQTVAVRNRCVFGMPNSICALQGHLETRLNKTNTETWIQNCEAGSVFSQKDPGWYLGMTVGSWFCSKVVRPNPKHYNIYAHAWKKTLQKRNPTWINGY